MVTLDETVEPLFDRLHLLKTDTEGFDVIALRGAKKLLMKTDMVIFECHFIQRKKAGGPGTTDYEVAQDLSDLGFEVYHRSIIFKALQTKMKMILSSSRNYFTI